MKKHLIIGCFALLALPVLVVVGEAQQRSVPPTRTQQDPIPLPPKTGRPAPRRDITGVWLGQVGFPVEPPPPMTKLGQELFDAAKPLNGPRAVAVAKSNDPMVTCDPLGFPRSIFFELRAFEFEQAKSKMIQLLQYQRVWREIWTDGRKLPTNVGAEGDSPDPRYYGYSVGHWESDDTFVVDSTGVDDKTWLNGDGYPHSFEAHIRERYTRPDHNDLQVTVTVDDPKLYTKPFVLGRASFRWHPTQELDEQLCIPSEMQQYLQLVGEPGGAGLSPAK